MIQRAADYSGAMLSQFLIYSAVEKARSVIALQFSTIGLYVDPMSVEMVPFYEQYGFLKADPHQPSRLEMWLPIQICLEIAVGIGKYD
jgi:hypothetical protein